VVALHVTATPRPASHAKRLRVAARPASSVLADSSISSARRPRAQRVGDQDLDLVGRELAGALEPAVAARGHDPGARDDGRDAGAASRPAPRGRHRHEQVA